MSLTKTMDVVPVSKYAGTKANTHRIENSNLKSYLRNMGSWRILFHVGFFLAKKHRVGLLMFSLLAYIALDHVGGLSNVFYIVYGTLFG